jgi:hypothetical protein
MLAKLFAVGKRCSLETEMELIVIVLAVHQQID